MELFTIISLLVAISGTAYAIIAAIKEYTDVFVEKKIKTAKEHLQNTELEKSGNNKLFLQACSNNTWGIIFMRSYRACFFIPLMIFSCLVIYITLVVYQKGGPGTEIITEGSWPTYKAMLCWVPISYAFFICLGIISLVVMFIFFNLLKHKSEVGLDNGLVTKTPQPEQAHK